MATRYPKKGKGTQWTTKELENIPAEWKGDTINDGQSLTGEVRVGKEGDISVVFNFRYSYQAKIHKLYCGSFPRNSIKEIRIRRDRAREALRSNTDPKELKQKERIEALEAYKKRDEDLTVDDLFEQWTTQASGVKRADGNKAIIQRYNKHAKPVIGNKKIRDLTDNNVLEVFKRIKRSAVRKDDPKWGNNGLIDNTYSMLRQMFGWAEKRKPWRALMADGNPVLMVEKKQVARIQDEGYKGIRNRVLSEEEIKELWDIMRRLDTQYEQAGIEEKHLYTEPVRAQIQCAIWICLGSLCRIGELVKSKWCDIDFEGRTWFIPAENTKGKRGYRQSQTVALSPFVYQQFLRLWDINRGTENCFIRRRAKGQLKRTDCSTYIGNMREVLKLSGGKNGNWTMHDLRRTGATMMQKLGIAPNIIDLCQNHRDSTQSSVAKHYLHYDYADEKAAAWEALGAKLEEIIA